MRNVKFCRAAIALAAAAMLCMNGCAPKNDSGATAAATTAAETTAAETTAAETEKAEETQKEEAQQAEAAEAEEDEDSEGGPGADEAADENAEIDEEELRGGKGRVVKSNTSGDLVKPEPTEGVMPEPPVQ